MTIACDGKPVKIFFPKIGSELEWNAAYCRLEDYLRALHIFNKVYQTQIILRLLERAAEKHAQHPDLCPTVLAMEELRTAMDRWFAEFLPPHKRVSVVGFLAVLASAVPEKWPMALLAEEIPTDCRRALHENEVRAVPELQVTSMVPQPFANPLLVGFNLSEPTQKLGQYLTPLVMKEAVSTSSIAPPPERPQ
jgi:hypothetical protein